MKKLIVNADDFGLHSEINKGIIKGHRDGFITSTSLMCSAPAFEEAVALAKECPKLGIGIHLTLVGGVRPLLSVNEIPSLVDSKGLLLPDYIAFSKGYYSGRIKSSDVLKELRAQIEAALASGLRITHVDSHQHTHILPGVSNLVLTLCREYGLSKMRLPKESYSFTGGFKANYGRIIGRNGLTFFSKLIEKKAFSRGMRFPDYFFGMLAGGNLNRSLVGNILKQLPEGVSEIMTHPGLSNYELSKLFSWQYHWEQELDSYLARENLQLLKDKNIELINFGDL